MLPWFYEKNHTVNTLSEHMQNVNIENFEIDNFNQAINNESKLVVVYFSAPWCQPCKSMKPVFVNLVNLLGDDNYIFGEVNIAVSPTIAPTYGIRSVPSVAIFKQNNIIKVIPGEIGAQDLAQKIKELD